MKLAVRIVILHFVASLAFLIVGQQELACCGMVFVITYLAPMAYFMINLPGVLVARALMTYSTNHTLGQEIAHAAVMIPSTEAVIVMIV